MIAVLRTIAIIDVIAVAILGAAGALLGLTPMQTLGAGIIVLLTMGIVFAWHKIVNATPGRRMRQDRMDWTHPSCDPVDRLPVERVTAEVIEPPARRVRVQPPAQIEAPRREVQRD